MVIVMNRAFPILLRERYRRCKKFIIQKPLFVIGLLISIVFVLASALQNPFYAGDFFNHSILVFAVMIYLIAKIINPTQGMTLDYQLVELKLMSLMEYKLLLGIKLLGGSIILSFICFNSYTKLVAVISMLNAVVNIWVFLRNRWNNKFFDLLIAIIVVVCIKYQAYYLSILSLLFVLGIYIAIKKVNYDSILPLYKLIYKIGQQRYNGIVYSDTESRDIQISAETLVGKAKVKNSDWCQRLFDRSGKFMRTKELTRITANSNKIVTYFIISLLISMSGFYIPGEYFFIAFILLAIIAMNFDMEMNRTEANLLLRGFIGKYIVSDIIKNKIFVYTVVNFIFMLPSILLGWKWLVLGLVFSPLIALFTLYKCFRLKAT